MRYYEMLFIVHPNYEQDRLDAVISSVQKEITSKGAKILKTDNWGKRKLAYLINKQRYGSYVLMYFEAEPAMIEGLYEWMEIQAQILHQMVIRLEEKPELTEESQNPDSAPAAPSKPAHAKVEAEPAKEKVEKVEVVEEVEEEAEEAAAEEEVIEEAAAEEEVIEEAAAEEEVIEEAAAEEEVVEEAAAEEEVVEEAADAPEVAEEATEEVKEGE